MRNIAFSLFCSSISSYTNDLLAPYLSNSFNLYLFHADSLYKDRIIKKSTLSKSYITVDFGNRKLKDIIKYIEANRIEWIIFFTFQSEFDKLILTVAKYLGIKTILCDHGIVFGKKSAKFININFYSLMRKFHFLSIKFKARNYYQIFNYKQEFDYYLFFSEFNKNYYNNFFNLNTSNVYIGGVPLFSALNEFKNLTQNSRERKILYLHQPFVKNKMSICNLNCEVSYINHINSVVRKLGYTLEVRFHPSVNFLDYRSKSLDTDILINNSQSLNSQASTCQMIIGHWSTALAIALPLNIPLIIFEYPGIKRRYKNFYSIYKEVAIFCKTFKDLENAIFSLSFSEFKYNTDQVQYLIGQNNSCEANFTILQNILAKNILRIKEDVDE